MLPCPEQIHKLEVYHLSLVFLGILQYFAGRHSEPPFLLYFTMNVKRKASSE